MILLLLFLTAGGIKILHFFAVKDALVLEPRGFLDDAYYHRLALSVAHGNLLARLSPTDASPFFLSPSYIYFLALVYRFFPALPEAAFLLQIFLGLAAAGLVYAAAADLQSREAGLWAAAFLAADGLAAMYECTLLPAALDPFFFALFIFALLKSLARPRLGWAFLAGAAAGAFALNRPNALLLLPPAALFFLFPRKNRRWKTAAVMAGGAALIILPVTLRNYVVSGDVVLVSSHGGLNFYIGNSGAADGFYHSPEWLEPDVRGQAEGARLYLTDRFARPVRPAEVSRLLYRLAGEEIRARPAVWIKLLAKKSLALLNARDAGLNLNLEYMRENLSPALRFLPVGPGLLIPFGIMGAAAGRKNRRVRLLSVLAAVYGVSVVFFFLSDRYRLPLHIPLAVLSGAGLASFRRASADNRRSEIALSLAVFLVVFVVSRLELGIPSGKGQMRLFHALRLIEAGRVAEAKEVADGMEPGEMNPFFWREKLARAYAARGALAEAAGEWEKLIRLAPETGAFHCEAGRLYLAAGRREEALSALARGVSLEPADEKCRADLETVRRLWEPRPDSGGKTEEESPR